MLGSANAAVPFFWSQHYDIPINYVGHAENGTRSPSTATSRPRIALLRFKQKGRVLSVVSIFRDVANLEAEVAMGARRNDRPGADARADRSSPRDRPRSP